MRSIITGSGIGIPKNLVPNDVLARIMETSDDWIRTRSGVEQRYYVDDGQGSSDLGVIAATAALDDAGRTKEEIDAIVFATMTPDHFFPGNGPVLQAKMGFPQSIPAFDIRQQCSGFLYGLDLADSLLRSGKHQRVLLVGADVHSPFMPWQNGWDTTLGKPHREVTPEEHAANTALRDRTVLFGDGAGAVVVERSDNGAGVLATRLFTNGDNITALHVPGVGFRRRPYVTHEQIDANEFVPVMNGREVFKEAVSKMPAAVREVCAAAGVEVADLDLLLVHQANLRIIEAVANQLGLPKEKVPHNIDRYGNTTAGTLPILFHELREAGRIAKGSLICFTALGAGLHWGAALYRA
jgi:3-oxoacyl-[acyl-carrier-protein] synthase III